jgi:hypothetical protein
MIIKNLVENKAVDILCSGPSATYHTISSDICIVPNRSILLPSIQEYKNIIWILGTGWKKIDIYNWWIEIANNVKVKPCIIMARKHKKDKNIMFDNFLKDFSSIFPESTVQPLKQNLAGSGLISTGMLCLKIAFDNGASSIIVSGMEMGFNTQYNDDLNKIEIISKKGNCSYKKHLLCDINYLNRITNKNKIIANKFSGLYKFLNQPK